MGKQISQSRLKEFAHPRGGWRVAPGAHQW